jgi:signal transduction histidine kinase
MTFMQTPSMYDPKIRAACEAAAAMPRWSRGWFVMRSCRAALLRHGLQVLVLCIAICWVLSLVQVGVPLWRQMAYSLPIGMTSWALIDGGRFFIDQDSPYLFPRGWRGGALIVFGVFAGFLVGSLFGDVMNGRTSFSLMHDSPQFFLYIFLFSMASGIGISLFFYSQGKSAYFQAEIEAKSRQTTEAQLKLLQSQLDPHMLFNTLANLRVLIPQEPERAVRMLDQLCDFLRATLSASRSQEHSLQAEFDRLRDYLALMQIRMGERLKFQLDLPAELSAHPVPTLILQSLVENAVLHGLEPKVGGGSVRISAAQVDGQLILQVRDDGMGMREHPPGDLTDKIAPNGFGLLQVRERLHRRYGKLAAIDFIASSAVNTPANSVFSSQNAAKNEPSPLGFGASAGCQVTLRIPLAV